VGADMGAALRINNEKQAYTLTDKGTWISFKNQLNNLMILVEEDVILMNPYSAILVNPEGFPKKKL
jgi:tungstate transport system substrate-binding protein